ncbi:MAG: metallophosphoesterase, partial [Myxococcota bacterium]
MLAACRPPAPVGPPRDWVAAPAFAQPADAPGRLWVVSDVHGGYQRLVALLQRAGLVNDALAWTGGADRLYVLGDLIDKTTGGLPTIELLRALEEQAPASGGLVVVSLGNHEAEFLADPGADKVATFATELREAALEPLEVARGAAGPGAWLRSRPFGIKDGAWFFSHSGHTGGRSLEELG